MRVVLVGLCLPERMTRLLLPRGGLSHSAPRRHSELDSESGAAKLLGCRPLRYRIKSGMTDFLGRCPVLSFWAWFRICCYKVAWLPPIEIPDQVRYDGFFGGADSCRHSELDSESGATKLLGCRPVRYRIKSGMTDFLGAVVPPRGHSELDSESGVAKLLGCRPVRYRIKSGMKVL